MRDGKRSHADPSANWAGINWGGTDWSGSGDPRMDDERDHAASEGYLGPRPRDVAVALGLGLLTALIAFAFFPWLTLAVPACVFAGVFAGVVLFGRSIACRD